MSIFSPYNSLTMFWMRMPRMPTQAPTGSSPSCRAATATFERVPASRAMALISTVPLWISGTSSSSRRRSMLRCARLTTSCGPRWLRCTSSKQHAQALAHPVAFALHLLAGRHDRLDLAEFQDHRARRVGTAGSPRCSVRWTTPLMMSPIRSL